MTRRNRRILLTAAVIIAQVAATLHDSYTVKGKWPRAEKEVRDDYLRMLLVAQALLKMRGKGA